MSYAAASLVDRLAARLRAAGCVFAEAEAALLLAEAVDPDHLDVLVRRREAGEPLEQVLGWVSFAGLRLTVASDVFVPRRRTEALAREAVRRLGSGDVLVDVCCGNGAVAAAVTTSVEGVVVVASDLDPAAVACARRNVRGTVVQGDLFEAVPETLLGAVAVVTANAPYVPSGDLGTMPREARLHEPRRALDGGADGVAMHRRIAVDAVDWLRPGGHLLIETSARQAPLTCAAMTAAGFDATVAHHDDVEGTVAVGVKPCGASHQPSR